MADPRTLGRKVLEPGFTIAGALVGVKPHEVEEAITSFESVQPLMTVEPNLDGPHAEALANHLRPIGAKIDPKISAEQATVWRRAMMLALSDLPPKVAISATRQAIHKPMQFLNEVEATIRTIAAEIENRHRLALHRLRMMRAEIERAVNPEQKQITDRAADPITIEEVAGWTKDYRRIGVECGFITQEMADAAQQWLDAEARKTGEFDTGEKPSDNADSTIERAA